MSSSLHFLKHKTVLFSQLIACSIPLLSTSESSLVFNDAFSKHGKHFWECLTTSCFREWHDFTNNNTLQKHAYTIKVLQPTPTHLVRSNKVVQEWLDCGQLTFLFFISFYKLSFQDVVCKYCKTSFQVLYCDIFWVGVPKLTCFVHQKRFESNLQVTAPISAVSILSSLGLLFLN